MASARERIEQLDALLRECADGLGERDSRIEQLEAMLRECADELAAEIDARYPNREAYPSEMHRYQRDMDTVNRARALLEC